MRVIAYGVLADYADEYLRIGEDTTIESVRRFAKVIIRVFGPEYLRAPNEVGLACWVALTVCIGIGKFPEGMAGNVLWQVS